MNIRRSLIFMTRKPRYALDAFTFNRTSHRDHLRTLEGRHAGKPMIILGNGPSVNQTPLDEFAHIPAIGMNKIDILYDRVKWRPELVVCTNNLVVQQHARHFADSDIPVYLSWKSRWSMPRQTKNVHYYLNRTTREFSTDIADHVGSAATVTYTALQLAWYMKADPVIIFGVDHSFKTTGANNDIQRREGADENHFDPNYFAHGSLWGVPNLDLSEVAYAKARQAFEADGRQVLDATVGGKLDIFPKISLDEARALCAAG